MGNILEFAITDMVFIADVMSKGVYHIIHIGHTWGSN